MEEKPTDKVSAEDEPEDIPSDFFDDFNRDDFMEGLSVIDSWDDEEKNGKDRRTSRSKRIDEEALDSVNDLRELIGENKEPAKVVLNKKHKWEKREAQSRRSSSISRLDDFIKPGSRRDPNKTNEAIKKDKEEKVKGILAKHLESADDLRPPGTELDDFFDEDKPKKVADKEVYEKPTRSSPPARQYRHSPTRRRSPRRSPRPRWSPRRQPRWSPRRQSHHSPQHPPWRISPNKKRNNFSPPYRRSPRRYSPRRRNYSRSPHRRTYDIRRSRSRSPHPKDKFLYPGSSKDPQSTGAYTSSTPYQPEMSLYPPMQSDYSTPNPGYSYSTVPAFNSVQPYTAPYDYGAQTVIPVPQSIPGPVINSMPDSAPAMVPAPSPVQPAPTLVQPVSMQVVDTKTPYDALAQLVAEGKISKEDYLKLAPNKGATCTSSMDTKTRVMVLSRCNTAMTKLGKLLLPNRLMMNNNIVGTEPKYLAPKFCSPLKRQATIDFHFTKTNGSSTSQQDKQLVDTIISTLNLDNVVTRTKKKPPKDMKDAAVQTTKPYCDVCEIRESTNMHDMCTSTNAEYFTSTVHTQVVEQDLVNSKSVFNPSGSGGDGAPISIAHMTPAQLVSQLAARAKTLKQTDPTPPQHQNLFPRRNPNFDFDGRGGQYHNYNNYRY